MAGGLAALLDDVAAIAKMASAAGSKAAAVVVDDAAVTPRYVHGFSPARELPIIGKIASGSLVNKTILIVALLLLDLFLPVVLVPLLMLGGLYLSFEGAEKIWEHINGHASDHELVAFERGSEHERVMIKGAITTDFILSAEIMMISLNTINERQQDMGVTAKAITLAIIALLITVLVYGVVAFIVKTDDVGLRLIENDRSPRLGRVLVTLMPKVLTVLSVVGVAAMLWVGGHILLDGAATLGWSALYDFVHHLAEKVHNGFVSWLIMTTASALVGVSIGGLFVTLAHFTPFHRHQGSTHQESQANTSSEGSDANNRKEA